MPRLTQGDQHVNRPISDMSFATFQKNENFIAKELPLIRSQTKSNQYFEYDHADLNRIEVKKRAPSTRAARGGFALTERTFTTVRYSLAVDVSDELENNYDTPLDPEGDAARYLANNMAMFHEDDMATTLFATGIWLDDLQGVAGVPGAGQFKHWNDAASTPINDIRGQKNVVLTATGHEPNEAWLAKSTWDILLDNDQVIDRYKANGGGVGARSPMSRSAFAELLELDVVRVSKGMKTSSAEGAATATFSSILSKKLLLVYVNRAPRPTVREPSAMYKFIWTGFYGAEETGMRTKRYREEPIGSTTVETDSAFVNKVTGSTFGVLFYDCHA
jgi:hypothetical protein